VKKVSYLKLSIVFAAVYFFSLNGIGALPQLGLSFLLKDKIHFMPAQMAYFQALTLLAWVIKPLWGLISDCLPIAGSRRKSYLLITSFVAGASWLALAFTPTYTAGNILLFISIGYLAYAFQDVVTDGLMVEVGQPIHMTGQFQSVQWSAVYLGMILTALVGGYLSELAQTGRLAFQSIFGITASFPLLTLFIAAFLIKEPPKPELQKEAFLELKQAFQQKDIWLLSLFLFLWNFSPSIGAPFFYYSVDTLKFSGSFLGYLGAVAAVGSLAGSILYGVYLAKLPVRKLLIFSALAGVLMTLFNLVFFMPALISHPLLLKGIALVSNLLLGCVSAFIVLILFNLAAITSPQYAGGTIFALLMSFFNLGLMASSALGGFLFPILGLKPLIWISSFFTLFALLVMPYLAIPEKLTPFEETVKKFLPFKS